MEPDFELRAAGFHAAPFTGKHLADHGFLVRVRHGWWMLPGQRDSSFEALVPHLAAPFLAYISFESALFHHGWLTQIPPRLAAATLGETRHVETALGIIDYRHLPAEVFGTGTAGDARLAAPEKAAFDWAYQAAHRGFASARFPELDPDGTVHQALLQAWLAKIPSRRVRRTTHRILVERVGLLAWNDDLPESSTDEASRLVIPERR